MGNCPACGKEMETLDYWSKVEASQDFSIDTDDNPEYSEIDDYGNHDNEEYMCPYCSKVLAYNERGAIKALKHKLTKAEATKIMLEEKMPKYEILFSGKSLDIIEADDEDEAEDTAFDKFLFNCNMTAKYNNELIYEEVDDDATANFIDFVQSKIKIKEITTEKAIERMLIPKVI